jgi:hypothetical protein
MVIGPKTYEYVKDDYLCLELDCLAVKGKSEGVNIYTIVDKTYINEKYAKYHKEFINYYRAQKWHQLDNYFTILIPAFNGEMKEYYEMMQERVEEYKVNPLPKDWDGIFRTSVK